MLPAPAVVPSPGGCGPCGAPPVTGTNGLKDPGAPGVGPVPLHCSWPAWPPVAAEPSWQLAKTGAGQPVPLPPGCCATLLGSQVGPPPLKLSHPWTTKSLAHWVRLVQ